MARRDTSPDFIEALARGLDVIHVQEPRGLLRYQSAQDAFSLNERQVPEIAPI